MRIEKMFHCLVRIDRKYFGNYNLLTYRSTIRKVTKEMTKTEYRKFLKPADLLFNVNIYAGNKKQTQK